MTSGTAPLTRPPALPPAAAGCPLPPRYHGSWSETSHLTLTLQDTPWCFYPDNVPNPCVGDNVYNWDAADPGFTEAEYQTMYTNYEANLNIRGTGAIIAAPDEETPGGDYRYQQSYPDY